MTTTQHPLTETAAAEMWDASRDPGCPLTDRYEEMRHGEWATVEAALRAAFDAGREHERESIPLADPHHDPRPWQDCTIEDIRKGDLVESRLVDILRIGVADRQDEHGDWYTEGGYQLAYGDHRPLRRIPAPTPPAVEVEMPSEFGDVILNPRWGARSYTRAVHLGEGVWASEVTPGAGVYTLLARDLRGATLPDGTRARRDGDHADGEPRFVKVREGEK